MISTAADKTANRIMGVLKEGSKELEKVKDQNDQDTGLTRQQLEIQQD